MCGGGGGDGPTAPLWIVSFSDMIANLVTFFIVLATCNAANPKGERISIAPVQSSPGNFGSGDDVPAPAFVTRTGDKNANFGDAGPENSSRRREQEVRETLDRFVQGPEYDVRVDPDRLGGGIRITLAEDGLFAAGSAAIKPSGARILEEIGNFFRGEKCHLLIEGHTDDRTWRLTDHASAADLTRAMARSVASAISERCRIAPVRIGISPLGSSRPVATEDSPAGRRKNRRIEIVAGRGP